MFGKRKQLEKKIEYLAAEVDSLRRYGLTVNFEGFQKLKMDVSRLTEKVNCLEMTREFSMIDLTLHAQVSGLCEQLRRHETTLQKLLLIPDLQEIPEVRVPAHYDFVEKGGAEKGQPEKARR